MNIVEVITTMDELIGEIKTIDPRKLNGRDFEMYKNMLDKAENILLKAYISVNTSRII